MAKTPINQDNPGFFISFSIPPSGHALYNHPNVRLVAKPKIGNLNNSIPSGYTGFPENLVSNNSPQNAAIQTADWLEAFRYTVGNVGQYEGALLLQDMSTVNHSGYRIYYDPRDALATGLPNYRETLYPNSVFFNASGVANFKEWASGYAFYLKQECDSRGLCYPAKAWCDVEDRLYGWNALRCSGTFTAFNSPGNASGPDIGTFRPSLLDQRSTSLYLTDTNKTLSDLWNEEIERHGTTFTSGLYILNSVNYNFFLWHDSLVYSLLSKGVRDAFSDPLKQKLPNILVGNYECVSALRNYPYYADHTSRTYAISPETQYLDYQCPVLYDFTSSAVEGGQSLSVTYRTKSLEKLESTYLGRQGKPIAAWILAPNLSAFGEYTVTVDDIVDVMNNGYQQYGVIEWLFFCGANYQDWDDLQDAIEQHLTFVAALSVEDNPFLNTCMWPDGMWVEEMWPITFWPICTPLLDNLENCVVCFPIDLCTWKIFDTEVAQNVRIEGDVIRVITNMDIPVGDRVSTITDLINVKQDYMSMDNAVLTSEIIRNITDVTHVEITSNISTDLAVFRTEITDIHRDISDPTNIISVYNLTTEYCSACGGSGSDCLCH